MWLVNWTTMIVQPRGVPKSYLTLKWQIFAPWGPICGSQRRAPDDGIVFLLREIPKMPDDFQNWIGSGRDRVPAGHCWWGTGEGGGSRVLNPKVTFCVLNVPGAGLYISLEWCSLFLSWLWIMLSRVALNAHKYDVWIIWLANSQS